MIFGRKKKQDEALDSAATPDSPDELDEQDELEDDDSDELVDQSADEPESDDEDDSDDDDADDADDDDADDADDEDEGPSPIDDSLREDGPFDIDEVDLDADDIDRLDFGCLVLTPFDGMQLQLQLDQATGAVQSALVVREQSALEIALFAAPAATSMVDEIVAEIVAGSDEAGGECVVGTGPYGVDLRRIMPVTGENGEQGYHISRTWYAQGPRWVLRGTLVGEAALGDDFSHPDAALLLEVFRNVVVRRGTTPKVPGDLIAMTMPEAMAHDLGASTEGADQVEQDEDETELDTAELAAADEAIDAEDAEDQVEDEQDHPQPGKRRTRSRGRRG